MSKNLDQAGVDALNLAIALLGGASALARMLNVRPSAVTNWRRRGRIPGEHCAMIELLTEGRIKRRNLRPAVFGSYRQICELNKLPINRVDPAAR